MTSDPLTILLRHNHWANAVLLDRCAKLTDAQFHQKFEIGLGSLHDTLAHIVGCVERWTQRVKGDDGPPKWPRNARYSVPQLIERNDASTRAIGELIDELTRDAQLDRTRTATFPSSAPAGTVDVTFTAGAAITHCLVHGSYHRAQAVNMLRRLNLPEPVPELDIIDWHHMIDN